MKKVLHISTYYPPSYGGIEQVAYDIVTGLKDKYEQKVICFNHDKGTVKDVNNSVEIIRIGFWKKIASQAFSFEYRKQLKCIIKEFKPNVIHLHLPNPLITIYLLTLNLKGIKLIIHWHSDIIKQKILRNFYKPFETMILKRADKIVVATNYHSEYSISIKKYRAKTIIFPYCLDFKKLENRDKNIERREEKIFFLGRHVPYKGIEYLIEASKYIKKSAEIVIAGSGPLTEKLKKQAEGLENIKFVGKISNEDVVKYLYNSNVFAFPSITRNEAFGVAMAEAMYCGLPVVSFAIEGSGVNWVNQDGKTGFVVENMNSLKFAEAVNRLLEDDSLREKLSENAKKWAIEQFDKDRFIANIIKTYEEE